jgi:hypothetical protein
MRLSVFSNKCRCGVVIPLPFMLTFVCVVIIFLELGTRKGWIHFCKKNIMILELGTQVG